MTTQTQINPGRRWVKGQSGNPRGRPRGSARQRLIAQWLSPYGGIEAVTPAEHTLLNECAALVLLPRQHGSLEHRIAALNAVKTVLAKVGLIGEGTPTKPEAKAEPVAHVPGAATAEVAKLYAEHMAKKDGGR
jgi:hypothetical protein